MRALVWAVALVVSLAGMAEAKKKLAVLEFGNGAGLKAQEVGYMVDVVRGEAVKLPRDKFLIMTKENILEMLPPGVDLASCEGDCEVETGRNIGADYLITGEFLSLGGDIKVSMRLYDTGSGGLVASEKGTATGVKKLEGVVQAAAGRLMKPIGHPGERKGRTFGLNLPALEEIQDTPLEARSAPELGGLADLDVGMLEKYEAATKVEQSKSKTVCEKVTAWRAVEGHPGVGGALRTEAKRRADHWRDVARSIVRRCKQVESVSGRYAADKQKLDRLMKLGDATLSREKKAELQAEFAESYGPWEQAIKQYQRDCKDVFALSSDCDQAVQEKRRRVEKAKASGHYGRPSWELGLARSQYKVVTDDNLDGRESSSYTIRMAWHFGDFTLGHSVLYGLGIDESPVSPMDMQLDFGWSPFSWPLYEPDSFSLLNPTVGLHGAFTAYFADSHPDGGVLMLLGGYFVRNTTYLDWLALSVEYRGALAALNTTDVLAFTVGIAFPH